MTLGGAKTLTQAVPLRTLDRRLHGLQYLRAVAALAVLLLHSFRLEHTPFSVLGLGVDLFFILSGFLMVAITDESTRPGEFLRARMARIVPLYWLITTLVVVQLWGGVSWESPLPFRHLANYIQDVPVNRIAASYLFVPWWNETNRLIQPIVPLGWTLNLEMMFYLLVGLSLLLPRPRRFPAVFAVLVTLATLGTLELVSHPTLVAWTNPIILEFLVGYWIGYVWQQGKALWPAFALAAILLLCAVAIAWFAGVDRFRDVQFVIAIPFAALLILVLQAEDRSGSVPNLPLLLLLGNASYAIYLIQFSVQIYLNRIGVPGGLLYGICMTAASVIAGIMLYKFVELPIMRARRQAVGAAPTGRR